MTLVEFRLPQFGMGMQDGTVVAWRKREGDAVLEGETLFELETAKTTVEVPSPCAGTLQTICVAEDENVPIQTVMAIIAVVS